MTMEPSNLRPEHFKVELVLLTSHVNFSWRLAETNHYLRFLVISSNKNAFQLLFLQKHYRVNGFFSSTKFDFW